MAGIATAESIDRKAFAVPTECVRQVYQNYLDITQSQPKRNFWIDKVSKSWLALDDAEKKKQISATLAQAYKRFGLQEDVEILEIKDHTRIILASFTQAPDKPMFHLHMIKLERILKETLEARLELSLESREDRNKRENRNPPPRLLKEKQPNASH